MSWYTIQQAAELKRVNTRQIYRLIQMNKLQSQTTPEGTMVWIDTPECSMVNGQQSMVNDVEIPLVPNSKITPEVLQRVEGMMLSISAASNIVQTEFEVETNYGITVATQRVWKQELRRMFRLQSRALLSALSGLVTIRQALESIIVRSERSDRNTLRSAKNLVVIVASGEMLGVEEFLKSLYPREGVNAAHCYRSLRARCLKRQVLTTSPQPSPMPAVGGCGGEGESRVATLEDLPSETSVVRFLRKWREENIEVRRGRSRKKDWEAQQQQFITRDVTQYRPGELWIGDHTELDFMVMNEDGKLDRRWISAFIDIRTGLLVGYHLSWQPNSQTIASAFRNGVLGKQLRAFVSPSPSSGEGRGEVQYVPVQMQNVPETVMMDNGKDYRSNYTKRVFGKVDFADDARRSVNRITKLHYVEPYHGQSKAQMERWFGVIQNILKYLPGYKGNTYQNIPDRLKQEKKSGEILPVAEFDAVVALAINSYNNRVHRTLKISAKGAVAQTPLQCYLTNQTQQRTIDIRVLDFLMMKVQNRVIRRCQVTILGNEYYSDALMPFNNKKADIYYDPNDIGLISVYCGGEFAAVACNKELLGQNERGWVKILGERKHGEKTMQEQLKKLREPISDSEARRMLLEGQLLNTEPVPLELLQKQSPTVTVLTGLEQDAARHDEATDGMKQLVEIERNAKKRVKKMAVNYDVVMDTIR